MKFAGRDVVISALDPVPPGLRVGARSIVMSRAEAKAIGQGDTATMQRLQRAIDAHDRKRLVDVIEGKGR